MKCMIEERALKRARNRKARVATFQRWPAQASFACAKFASIDKRRVAPSVGDSTQCDPHEYNADLAT